MALYDVITGRNTCMGTSLGRAHAHINQSKSNSLQRVSLAALSFCFLTTKSTMSPKNLVYGCEGKITKNLSNQKCSTALGTALLATIIFQVQSIFYV